MNYKDFLKINYILESNGSDINSFVKSVTGRSLNEADLDTQSGNIITRVGRARRALNKNAEKVQTILMTNLYNKFYSEVLENKKKIINQIEELKKNNKTSAEIKSQLQGNLQNALAAQKSQVNVLDKAADKILLNYTKKIDALISKNKMSENNKLSLSNYWVMLSSQLKLNLYKYIQKQELKFVNDSINKIDDKELVEIISDEITDEDFFNNLINKQNNVVNDTKKTAKESIANEDGEKIEDEKPEGEKTEDEKPEGEKTEDEKPEGEKTEDEKPEGESEEIKPEDNKESDVESVEAEEVNSENSNIVDDTSKPLVAGDTYTYVGKDGSSHTIEVVSIGKDGMKFKKDGKEDIFVAGNAIAEKMKFTKALNPGNPPSRKKPIKTQDTSSSTGKTHVMPQKTASGKKLDKKVKTSAKGNIKTK